MSTKTFNIALPEGLVKEIDETAKAEYKNRSEFIREAVQLRLKELQNWNKIFRAGREAAKRLGIKSEADVDRIVHEYRHGRKPKKGRS